MCWELFSDADWYTVGALLCVSSSRAVWHKLHCTCNDLQRSVVLEWCVFNADDQCVQGSSCTGSTFSHEYWLKSAGLSLFTGFAHNMTNTEYHQCYSLLYFAMFYIFDSSDHVKCASSGSGKEKYTFKYIKLAFVSTSLVAISFVFSQMSVKRQQTRNINLQVIQVSSHTNQTCTWEVLTTKTLHVLDILNC